MVTYSRKVLKLADFGSRDAARPFQVLRLEPDAGKRKNLVSFPQSRVAVNHHMGVQAAPRPEYHVFADDAKRADLTRFAHARLRMDDRRRMD